MKIIFIIPTGEEAELVYPLYIELVKRGHEVINIETGNICCSKDTKMPAKSLQELGMVYKSIYSYRTRSAAKILQIENPDIIIIGSDQEYLRRTFVYASKQLGIPCLLIDVAFGSNIFKGHWITIRRTLYRFFYYPLIILNKYLYILKTVIDLKWGINKILHMIIKDIKEAFVIEDARGMYGCDMIFVAGNWEKEVLVDRGVNPKNIFVTGNPRMTALLQERNIDNERKIREELGIGENNRIILLHTSAQVEHGRWSLSMRKMFINKVIDSISPLLNDNTKLILRIHPVESYTEYQEIIKGRKENIILCKGNSFVDIINMSDVIIFGAYSMMVLEATALGKVVILLNTFNEVKNLPYEEMGLAKCVYNFDEIQNNVNILLNCKTERDNFIKQTKYFFDNNKEFVDGQATQRIVDLIVKIVEKK